MSFDVLMRILRDDDDERANCTSLLEKKQKKEKLRFSSVFCSFQPLATFRFVNARNTRQVCSVSFSKRFQDSVAVRVRFRSLEIKKKKKEKKRPCAISSRW